MTPSPNLASRSGLNRLGYFALRAFCEIIYLLHSKRNAAIGSTFVAA
jgi:hypothetical protein